MDESPIKDDPEAEEPQAPADVEQTPPPKAPASTELVFEGLASGKEPWRGGSGCSSRLPLYGCLFGLVLLIGILFVGTSMMRRTVWVNLEKARRAVVQSLPRDLPAAERQRTIDNLERLRAMLEASKDPYPEMGEFVNRVREVLQDGRFTVEEVGGLNIFIERMIEEAGVPPMQVGAEIRSSEFGIRNADYSESKASHLSFRARPQAESRNLFDSLPSLRTGLDEGCRNFSSSDHPTDPSARGVPALGRDDILDGLPGSACLPVLGRVGGNSEFRIPNSEFV